MRGAAAYIPCPLSLEAASVTEFFTMKRLLSQALGVAGQLAALLAACIGCTKSPEPPKPRELHWHGQDSGYRGSTPVEPNCQSDANDK